MREIKSIHPNDGEVIMAGHLNSRGTFVTRAKLQVSIHREANGVAERRSVAIKGI